MDSITQIVLGAAVGEAVAGKHIGNKAALWGAFAGTIPDLDVLFMGFFNPLDATLFHRGFSHSFLFACIIGPILGMILHKISKVKMDLKSWILLFFLGIVTHPILDMFTTYGTEFLWPFPNRIAFNTVFVIDPLYTIPFMICLILAMRLPKSHPKRFHINMGGIIYSTSYLLLGVVLKLSILFYANNNLDSSNINPDRTSVSPMPLTIFYWMTIKEDRERFYIDHTSIFNPQKKKIRLTISKNHHLLQNQNTIDSIELKKIEFISKGYYTVEKIKSKLNVYDLRFGCAAPLTNNTIKIPLMGYTFDIENEKKLGKIEKIRPNEIFQNLSFFNYLSQIFTGE
jgi:inner membrane protein